MRVSIDFVRPRKLLSLREGFLLFGSLVALAVSIWSLATTTASLASVEEQLANQKHIQSQKPALLTDAQRASINRAIRQLNLPWPELLSAIEAHSVDRVALLSLEPDAANRMLRVTGEAKSPDEMLEFVNRLGSDPLFVTANLLRHEVNESDRNRPYRFVMEATWQID